MSERFPFPGQVCDEVDGGAVAWFNPARLPMPKSDVVRRLKLQGSM